MDILTTLSHEINPLFQEYRENWGVSFDINTDIKKFRDLISDEIIFFINDGSNKFIEGKGSGLQRLAYILLHHRIIEKIQSNSVILLIDEPDVYLHQGLQKKLLEHLKNLAAKAQIFVTTHSPVFIDPYALDNVYLLDLQIDEKLYQRKNRTFNVLKTIVVEIDQIDGIRKIRNYLGIEDLDYELLNSYNIIVEGSSDKIYLESLSRFFGLPVPNIVSANGADNIFKFLEFYQSFYTGRNNKPCLLVLLDNDSKGRDVYGKIKELNKYSNLQIYKELVPNFMGESNSQNTNYDWQIEDFVYPQVLCWLVNEILKKRNEGLDNTKFKSIKLATIETKIQQPAFKHRGILALIENEKNEKNPEIGQIINFISSQLPSEQMKHSLAKLFEKSIQGNRQLITLIQEGDSRYPDVKEFLTRITNAHNFIQV